MEKLFLIEKEDYSRKKLKLRQKGAVILLVVCAVGICVGIGIFYFTKIHKGEYEQSHEISNKFRNTSHCKIKAKLKREANENNGESSEFSNEMKEQIKLGIDAAEAIAEFTSEEIFTGSTKELLKSIASYLGVVGPFIDFVCSFIHTESEEMKYFKKMMEHFDERFDEVELKLDELIKLAEWTDVSVKVGELELKILAQNEAYRRIYLVSFDERMCERSQFMSTYTYHYGQSGYMFYLAVSGTEGSFQKELAKAVMKKTNNDRLETHKFLRGTVQDLLKASTVELAFRKLSGYNTTELEDEWQKQIQTVINQFQEVDKEIVDNYFSNAQNIIENLVKSKKKDSNENLASDLYKRLTKKFYWRDWLVVVYDKIGGNDKHWIQYDRMSTFIKFRYFGKNIIVSSVDKSIPYTNYTLVDLLLSNAVSIRVKDISTNSRIVPFVPADVLLHRICDENISGNVIGVIKKTAHTSIYK